MQNLGSMSSSHALPAGETFDVDRLHAPDEALAAFFSVATFAVPAVESASLADAVGRILAIDAVSDARYPANPRATMDGYAIQTADGATVRSIVGEVRMGHAPPFALAPGTAMRIPTGGVLPDGADAVVPIEDAHERSEGGSVPSMTMREPVVRGENFTPVGEDMEPGEVVLRAGRRIAGPELSVLATLGYATIPVYRRPRVAIVSTGDELVDPAKKPGPGQVRDSNRWAIAGTLWALGCEAVQRPVAPDTPEASASALRSALDCADAVIFSGGSSVGTRDVTPQTIDALGAPGVIVHGLRIKPGKPTVLALVGGKPVIGLPGNPASSLMVLEAIVAPIFSRLAGHAGSFPSELTATAEAPFPARQNWTWYIPARVRGSAGRLFAAPLELRSARTSLLAQADGYVIVGPERGVIAAGERVTIHRFRGVY